MSMKSHQGTWDRRTPPSTRVKKDRQCSYVVSVRWQGSGSLVSIHWDWSTVEILDREDCQSDFEDWWLRENTCDSVVHLSTGGPHECDSQLIFFFEQKHCSHGGKGRSQIPSRRQTNTRNTFFTEHNQKADHWANLGQRKIIVHRNNDTDRWKAVRGFWMAWSPDQRSKQGQVGVDPQGCGAPGCRYWVCVLTDLPRSRVPQKSVFKILKWCIDTLIKNLWCDYIVGNKKSSKMKWSRVKSHHLISSECSK